MYLIRETRSSCFSTKVLRGQFALPGSFLFVHIRVVIIHVIADSSFGGGTVIS